MNIRPLKTKRDYNLAMARLDKIFDAKMETPEGDELEVLGILIQKYEFENYPIDFPDPIEAIKFRMGQMGYNQTDLANVIGFPERMNILLRQQRQASCMPSCQPF